MKVFLNRKSQPKQSEAYFKSKCKANAMLTLPIDNLRKINLFRFTIEPIRNSITYTGELNFIVLTNDTVFLDVKVITRDL